MEELEYKKKNKKNKKIHKNRLGPRYGRIGLFKNKNNFNKISKDIREFSIEKKLEEDFKFFNTPSHTYKDNLNELNINSQ